MEIWIAISLIVFLFLIGMAYVIDKIVFVLKELLELKKFVMPKDKNVFMAKKGTADIE